MRLPSGRPGGPFGPRQPADGADSAGTGACQGRDETPMERYDRNFAELLQELRVLQTGVQILFAFLLTLAFTPRFMALDAVQRTTYVSTLLMAVLSAVLLTAPAAVHRVLFRRGAKALIVSVSSRLTAIGMAVLALSLSGAVLLVVDVVLGRGAGVAAGIATLAVCGGLWALLPFVLGHLNGHVRPAADPAAGPPPDRSAAPR